MVSLSRVEEEMKSFKQFVLEQDLSNLSAKKTAEMIVRECSYYLKEVDFSCDPDNMSALFRGISGKLWSPGDAMIVKHRARADREPMSTPSRVHAVLDAFFEDSFGFPYRGKGTFAVGYPGVASGYGQVNLIFPIGKFSYVWSQDIEDAFNSFGSNRPEMKETIVDYAERRGMGFEEDELDKIPNSQHWADAVELYLRTHPDLYQDNSLSTAAKYPYNTYEIMLSCDEYYTVPYAYPSSSPAAKDAELQLFVEEMLDEIKDLM